MRRLEAALQGVREIGFTVLSMSLSLIAIFIPLLFMGDLLGRILREFAVTLSVAVLISLVVSLTTAPMLCAHVLEPESDRRRGWLSRALERRLQSDADKLMNELLAFALRHSRLTLAVLFAFAGLNVYLYIAVPKGLFPQQDPGWLYGFSSADPNISRRADAEEASRRPSKMILADPAVQSLDAMIEEGRTQARPSFTSF